MRSAFSSAIVVSDCTLVSVALSVPRSPVELLPTKALSVVRSVGVSVVELAIFELRLSSLEMRF